MCACASAQSIYRSVRSFQKESSLGNHPGCLAHRPPVLRAVGTGIRATTIQSLEASCLRPFPTFRVSSRPWSPNARKPTIYRRSRVRCLPRGKLAPVRQIPSDGVSAGCYSPIGGKDKGSSEGRWGITWQKLIKVGDRSEHGWSTVDEYVEDELADDSDDEKRLFRAWTRAWRKLKGKANESKKTPNIKGRNQFYTADLGPVVDSLAFYILRNNYRRCNIYRREVLLVRPAGLVHPMALVFSAARSGIL